MAYVVSGLCHLYLCILPLLGEDVVVVHDWTGELLEGF